MNQRFEYKFVRLPGPTFLGIRPAPREAYRKHIEEHAREGWRFVQVFAPGNGIYGSATYYDLVFEREISAS